MEEFAHISILKGFQEIPFNVGRKTMIDFLKGNPNLTIEKNKLDELDSYGVLYRIDFQEISNLLDQLEKNNYVRKKTLQNSITVIELTPEGRTEIYKKQFRPRSSVYKKKLNIDYKVSRVDETDKKLFEQFSFFLDKYNNEQKKAIISDKSHILCVAGAGSGKTTVLTKRIEFLNKFRSVKQEDILGITFTRKARDEMRSRLDKLSIKDVNIETFNSFSEKLLKKYSKELYGDREVRVATYSDKIKIVSNSMKKLSLELETIADDYFNKKQLKEKSMDELFFIFVNDIFSIIDFYKNIQTEIKPFYESESNSLKRRIAKSIYEISKEVSKELKARNLRDFTDQIVDVIELLKNNQDLIPKYSHILIDEYQDINLIQFELIKLLNSNNIFVVGDPRQAIYGWRGSDINYIINYPKEFENTQVISLTKNYRSKNDIVDLFNNSISSLGLDNLDSTIETKENNVFLIEQDNEKLERIFVCESIKNSKANRNEIFILARTNRILENYADYLTSQGIDYTIKSEEDYKSGEPKENEVVLATVHSIKGMEAREVYVVSANSLSYPNKVQDNFVLALVKEDFDYNKEQEELRLFYVALSRAKDKLIITYTGNLSKFVNSEMLNQLRVVKKNKDLFQYASDKKLDKGNSSVLKNLLRDWRTSKSNQTGLPTYMILSNAAIEDLVIKKPSTKYDLEAIRGLGDMKIAKYGEELLKIISGN